MNENVGHVGHDGILLLFVNGEKMLCPYSEEHFNLIKFPLSIAAWINFYLFSRSCIDIQFIKLLKEMLFYYSNGWPLQSTSIKLKFVEKLHFTFELADAMIAK